MSVEGNWKITVKSPVGPQVSIVVLHSSGGVLTGTQSGQGTTSEISEGKVDGNTVYWVNHVTTPMKMKVEFTGTVDGDQITGKVKAGMMGSFSFAGVKEP
jgi:hypothetical protein